jgi:predicted DNA-binding protein
MAISKIQTGLRIDEDTYGKLKALSIKEGRSLNNLAEFIIKKYISDYEEQNGEIHPVPCQDN